jgi:hypothetical protein
MDSVESATNTAANGNFEPCHIARRAIAHTVANATLFWSLLWLSLLFLAVCRIKATYSKEAESLSYQMWFTKLTATSSKANRTAASGLSVLSWRMWFQK